MHPIINAHASAGGGHRSVATAINHSLERDFGLPAMLADNLAFASPAFRVAYGKGYEFSAQNMRWLCKLIYRLTDAPASNSRLTAMVERFTAHQAWGLYNFIRENNTEIVCCTHYLPLVILGEMKRKNLYTGHVAVCVTDFQVHGFWADPGVDHYFVPTEEARQRMLAWGYEAERVEVSGIPVRDEFALIGAKPCPKRQDERLRVLFSASTITVRQARLILRELEDTKEPINLTVITGRNQVLRDALASWRPRPGLTLDLHGFEPQMEDFMYEADLMITKPGGITCSESLCAGLPMLFVAPIPMHEVYNAALVSQAGAGKMCFTPGLLGQAIKELAARPEQIAAMRQACLAYAKPQASHRIAQHLAGLALSKSAPANISCADGIPEGQSFRVSEI